LGVPRLSRGFTLKKLVILPDSTYFHGSRVPATGKGLE
jgi:hypothetical protein